MNKPDPTAKFTLTGSYNRQEFLRMLAAMGLTALVLGLASTFYFESDLGLVWTLVSLFILLTPAGLITVLLFPVVRRHEFPIFAAFAPALILYVLGIQQALTHLASNQSSPTETSLSTFLSAGVMIALLYGFYEGLPLIRRSMKNGQMSQILPLNEIVGKPSDPENSLRAELARVLVATAIAVAIMDAVPFLLIGAAIDFTVLIDDFLIALPIAIAAAFFLFFMKRRGFRLPASLIYLITFIYGLSYASGVYQATRPFAIHGGAENVNGDHRVVMLVGAIALITYLVIRLAGLTLVALRQSGHNRQAPTSQQLKKTGIVDRQMVHLLLAAGALGLLIWQPLPATYVDSTLEPDAILTPPSFVHYQGLMEDEANIPPDCTAPTFLTTDGREEKPVPGLTVKTVRAFNEPVIYLINLASTLSTDDRSAIVDHMATLNQRIEESCGQDRTQPY